MTRGPRRSRAAAGGLALLAACASSPPPPAASTAPPPVVAPPSVEEAAAASPCASTVLCVDRAEARADLDPVAAEADLRRCLECEDVSPAGYRLLADLVRLRGDLAGARRVLAEGRRRFPNSASLALAAARLDRDDGRVQAALAAFARAARAHPRDEIIAREYEAMLRAHGSPTQRREVELRPLLREAAGRFELGDVDGARQTLLLALDRAQGLSELSVEIRHRLALVELAGGWPDRAAAEVTAALDEVGEDRARRFELLLTLGEIRMAEARWEAALKVTRRALELEPNSALAWANLALASAALGRMDPAIEAFAQAVDLGLSRRLTFAQLEGIGAAFERLRGDPRFGAIADRGWPGRPGAQAR